MKKAIIINSIFMLNLLLSSSIIYAEIDDGPVSSPIIYNDKGMRDPFIPLYTGTRGELRGLYGVENVDDITIEGFVKDPSGSIVIVNGIVLKEGEKRDRVTVVEIRDDGIAFLINDEPAFKEFAPEETRP